MNLAVDVYYKNRNACIAGVAFNAWTDAEPSAVFFSTLNGVAAYVPGKFFKRELPCILKLLKEHDLAPECIIVDGFVYLDGHKKAGLGKHLYDALGGRSAVIGVAKQPFKNGPGYCRINRGQSSKPLYITSKGFTIDAAKEHILSMHGEYRIPTLLKRADQLCRTEEWCIR